MPTPIMLSNSYVMPYLCHGYRIRGGVPWFQHTYLSLVNVGIDVAYVNIAPRTTDGAVVVNPGVPPYDYFKPLPINGTLGVSCQYLTFLAWDTTEQGDYPDYFTFTGWCSISSSQPLVGYARFRYESGIGRSDSTIPIVPRWQYTPPQVVVPPPSSIPPPPPPSNLPGTKTTSKNMRQNAQSAGRRTKAGKSTFDQSSMAEPLFYTGEAKPLVVMADEEELLTIQQRWMQSKKLKST